MSPGWFWSHPGTQHEAYVDMIDRRFTIHTIALVVGFQLWVQHDLDLEAVHPRLRHQRQHVLIVNREAPKVARRCEHWILDSCIKTVVSQLPASGNCNSCDVSHAGVSGAHSLTQVHLRTNQHRRYPCGPANHAVARIGKNEPDRSTHFQYRRLRDCHGRSDDKGHDIGGGFYNTVLPRYKLHVARVVHALRQLETCCVRFLHHLAV
mmetsp:Transcript_29760/g.68903  ORF Transcript_29760/g.68903 Transcript_29760/m.68903 type:complete len:207 (-) Transcript_29760:98-718(-)